MINSLELDNCPEEYALNCKGYEIKCHDCKANSTGKYLQYSPIDKSITTHPASIKQKAKTNYSRRGKHLEKQFINKKDELSANYASGSIGGDGDATMDIPLYGPVRVEIKSRFKKYNSRYVPTLQEIREGKKDGVKVWIINNACNDYASNILGQSINSVFIDAYLLVNLICIISMYDKCEFATSLQTISYASTENTHVCKITIRDSTKIYSRVRSSLLYSLRYYEVKRGFKPPSDKWKGINDLSFIKSKHGSYVLTTYKTFTALLQCLTLLQELEGETNE